MPTTPTTTAPTDKTVRTRTKPKPDTLRDAAKIRDILARHDTDNRKLVIDAAVKALAETANGQ